MKADTAAGATVLHLPPMPKKVDFTATNRLREIRERGLHGGKVTLQMVATALGTTPTHIARLETGNRDLSLEWMLRLARFYGVAPADIFLAKDGGLDPAERELVDTLREVPAANRAAIQAFVQTQQPWRGTPEVLPLDEQRPLRA